MNKEDFLKTIVEKVIGYPCGFPHAKLNKKEIINRGLDDEVTRVYNQLGGIMNEYPINYRWDITYPDFIIELDEELHFNRYRYETLQSSLYDDYVNFDVDQYRRFCQVREKNCLKAGSYGGKWKNSSTDTQFQPSNTNGVLDGAGSSRWKQRAFYDFLKDVHAIIKGIPVIRISIYDIYDNQRVDSILSNHDDKRATDLCISLLKQHDII